MYSLGHYVATGIFSRLAERKALVWCSPESTRCQLSCQLGSNFSIRILCWLGTSRGSSRRPHNLSHPSSSRINSMVNSMSPRLQSIHGQNLSDLLSNIQLTWITRPFSYTGHFGAYWGTTRNQHIQWHPNSLRHQKGTMQYQPIQSFIVDTKQWSTRHQSS